jgi:hypothetical protein
MESLWYSLNPVVRRILDGERPSERKGRGLKVSPSRVLSSVHVV